MAAAAAQVLTATAVTVLLAQFALFTPALPERSHQLTQVTCKWNFIFKYETGNPMSIQSWAIIFAKLFRI
jgi:hypothetical protein